MPRFFLIAGMLTVLSQPLGAHEGADDGGGPEEWRLQATLATSYRTETKVATGQRWIIPGFLMGGEALPMPKGFHLDELTFNGFVGSAYRYAQVKLGQHGAEDLTVEHALVGQRLGEFFRVELGRMSADFSPYNALHPSQSPFSEALLLYDALWGRQHNDLGIRLKAQLGSSGLEAGLEAWQGDAFPAKRSGNIQEPYDVFLAWQGAYQSFRLRTGAFYYLGRASGRKDERYSAEHSHGIDSSTIPVYFFDGKTANSGVHGRLEWGDPSFLLGAEGEYQRSESEGHLRDTTRLAPLQTEYKAYWWSLYHRQNDHEFAARWERLQFDNQLSGAGATALAEQAGLIGSKDPYRLGLSYHWHWDPSLKLRAEWIRDFSTLQKKDMGTVGVIWAKSAQSSRS